MKLIKLENKFILVSDEKLKDGDWFYNTFSDNQPLIQQRKGDWTTCFNQQKIIAGISELPSIDFSSDELGEEGRKRIGYVDVEKLAQSNCYKRHETYNSEYTHAYIEGFNTTQSLNKEFSLEDMIKCTIEHAKYCQSLTNGIPNFSHWCHNEGKDFIQSLQKTEWEVEVERECVYQGKCVKERCLMNSCDEKQPKITNNSIRVIKIL